MAEFFHGRLFRFLASCLAIYGAAAATTDAPFLILVLNDLVMSAAAGVCVAYAPILPIALGNRKPFRADFLGVGIFCVAISVLMLRFASFVGRDAGHPEIYNSHFIPLALTLALIGAILHLWAPSAREGRISARRWLKTGIVVAIGGFVALGSWSLHLTMTHPAFVELR